MCSRRLLLAFLPPFVLACSSSPEAPSPSPAPPPTAKPPPAPLPQLEAEAGFVDVPPQRTGARYAARMFYAFRPADDDPAHKPLFVFFNGGPGFATSIGLLAYGTGPSTLRDGQPPGTAPTPNASSFSRFANLLYVDERTTGFSYALRGPSDAAPDFNCSYSLLDDAADFAIVLVTFLEAHAALRAAKVALVGESYGGARATALLQIFLHYDDPHLAIQVDLRHALEDHFQAIFPESPRPYRPSTVAEQFGNFVLIQPLVLGPLQWTAQTELLPADPYVGLRSRDPAYDVYDLSKPAGWSTTLDVRALGALASVDDAKALVGIDLSAIKEILPSARKDALRPPLLSTVGEAEVEASHEANAALERRLGALAAGDAYLAGVSPSCVDSTTALNDISMANWFLDDLRSVRLFLTHARWDGAIYVPAIAHVLNAAKITTTVDETPRAGEARPGRMTIAIPAEEKRPAADVVVRFPSYDASGHMVAVSQGEDLADDVEAWWKEGR